MARPKILVADWLVLLGMAAVLAVVDFAIAPYERVIPADDPTLMYPHLGYETIPTWALVVSFGKRTWQAERAHRLTRMSRPCVSPTPHPTPTAPHPPPHPTPTPTHPPRMQLLAVVLPLVAVVGYSVLSGDYRRDLQPALLGTIQRHANMSRPSSRP